MKQPSKRTLPKPVSHRQVRVISRFLRDRLALFERKADVPVWALRDRKLLPRLVVLAGVVGLAACTAPVSLPQVPTVAGPLPGATDTPEPYKLQVGDTLEVKFPLNPELNDQITVRPDGMISTGFVQDVRAFNHTVAEVTEDLRARYKQDLTNPNLSVILLTFAPNRIYVAGEVVSPGEFITIGPNLTLSQAISRAGGVKFSANREKVFIIRRGPRDVPLAYATDYFGVITGADPAADIRLSQYDVVYVSRTAIGDVYQVANQYFLQFFPVGATAELPLPKP